MKIRFETLWAIYLLKYQLGVTDMDLLLDSERSDPQIDGHPFKSGPPKVTVTDQGKLKVVQAFRFPRCCGKTTMLVEFTKRLNDRCLYVCSNDSQSKHIKQLIGNNTQTKTTTTNRLIYMTDDLRGCAFNYFVFDDFYSSLEPHRQEFYAQTFSDVLNQVWKLSNHNNEPSLAVFVH